MLIVHHLNKRFIGAEAPILTNIQFTVNAGERVGLVGPNGSGKSTLLRIIAGEDTPDSGAVTFSPSGLRMAYLAQGIAPDDERPIIDALFPQRAELLAVEAELEALAADLAMGEPDAAEAYSVTLDRLTVLSEQVDEAAGLRMLASLGLDMIGLEDPVGMLSGGQKTRLMLASILIQRPQLLLLDEPTNHLDAGALEWLENWLLNFEGGALVVSHDRAFLDRVANRIVAIDPMTQTARTFPGGYSDYLATIAHEREQQWNQWQDQQVTIARMKADISRTMSRAVKKENSTVHDFHRGRAKVLAQKAKAKETRLNRYIESEERVDKPQRSWDVKIDFDHLPRAYGDLLALQDVSIGYTPDAPLLENITLAVRGGEHIAIMGPNGSGKTTLLRTILGELPPLAGEVRLGGGIVAGYLAQEQDILDLHSTPLATLQAEARMTETEARSFLHFFLFAGDDALRSNASLSYGERARLMLARLVARGCNLLVLDEPLNHLDLPSREQFEAALSNFPGSMIMVSHDRYLVERFATQVWHLEAGRMQIEHRVTA